MFRIIFFYLSIFLIYNVSLEAGCYFRPCWRNCYYNYDLYSQYYGYRDIYTYPNGYALPINCCFPYYRKCSYAYEDQFCSNRMKSCSSIRPFTRERTRN